MLGRIARAKSPPLWAAALLIGVSHGLYTVVIGVRMAPDSHGYAHWSARLIESGFDYPSIIAQASGGFPAILYALFGTLLAGLRLVFGSEWAAALVVLNFGTHVILGLLIVRLVARLTRNAPAAWGALLLYLGCFDLLMWVPFVLSDATFVLLTFGIFTLAAARILGTSQGWGRVVVPATAAVFYRPTGLVLLPDLAWAFYLSRSGRKNLRRQAIFTALAVAIPTAAFAFVWVIQEPSRWPLDALSTSFRIMAAEYSKGEVVSGRPETYHAPPAELIDYVIISADRFVHFFAIGARDFSVVHWVVEAAFFLPVYALTAWLGIALGRGRTTFEVRERKVFLAAFGALLSYAAFHALVQVDFDWRYRTPILPHLILLAAGGLADLMRRRST